MNLDSSVKELSGVGEERAKKLSKLGIQTVSDLLYYFPRTYEIRGDVVPVAHAEIGKEVSVILTVGTDITVSRTKKDLVMYSFRGYDESGSLQIIFFRSPFVKQVFKTGLSFRFFGKVQWFGKILAMIAPKYEAYIPGIPLPYYHPVYPLTAGLTSGTISSILQNSIYSLRSSLVDPLPESIRLEYQLPSLGFAIQNAHFPVDKDALASAIKRLSFDELFEFALLIAKTAQMQKQNKGVLIQKPNFDALTSLLPFELTNGQKNAITEIVIDMTEQRNGSMNRILIGDVGSGKTICAVFAAYAAIQSKKQVVLMAPTEILASQHYASIKSLFDKLHISSALRLGSTKKSEKTKILAGLENGEISIVIGTHALLNDLIKFKELGLVITDEQHRFGIKQRAILKEKNASAHILVMSATPIPRSLALALYGDLNVSRITEMPKGRQRVDTFVVDETYRERLQKFIKKQVEMGGQCYIVCPAIENENEDGTLTLDDILSHENSYIPTNVKKVLEYSDELKRVFKNLSVGVLHGKMKLKEKDAVMSAFVSGKIDILVSTTVIEVGIDNPNATLMIIENADRFGLSQLHQLRGRVGRSEKKSYCILVSDSDNEKTKERLGIMKTVYDGFTVAEKDLLLRGPGDFFSLNSDDSFKQSGEFHFKFASMQKDESFMERVFSTAKSLINADPNLEKPSNLSLQAYILPYLKNSISSIS